MLEGPDEAFIYTDEEYSTFVDDETFDARPDHVKEINYFKEPRNGRIISTSTLVSFAMCASPSPHDRNRHRHRWPPTPTHCRRACRLHLGTLLPVSPLLRRRRRAAARSPRPRLEKREKLEKPSPSPRRADFLTTTTRSCRPSCRGGTIVRRALS